jgi:hypothetical protein
LLPKLAGELKEQSIFNATSTRAASIFLGSNSIQSKEQRNRFPFEVRNSATVYQEAMRFKSLSALEEDLDRLLKIGEGEATACQEARIFNDYDSDSNNGAEPFMGGHQGLMITSTPQDRFMYWKGKKPTELLGDDACLVAHLDTLPYQEGRPLTTVAKIGTVLVNYSFDEHSSHRHIYMVEVEAESNEDPNELLEQISGDEVTADASNENDAEHATRRLRNQKCATGRRNAAECQRHVWRDLDAEFAAASEWGFQTPIANIAGVTAILAANQDSAAQQALRLAQNAWLQLNRHTPAPSVPANEEQVGESCSHPQASQTPGGHP